MILLGSVLLTLGGLLLLLLSLLIHDRLHGWPGSFCPEQNHTTKPNCMLSVYHWTTMVLTETHKETERALCSGTPTVALLFVRQQCYLSPCCLCI